MVVDGRHHLQRQRIAAVSTKSEYRIANRSTLFSQVVDDYMYYLTERDSIDKCHLWLQSTTFGTEYLSFSLPRLAATWKALCAMLGAVWRA